LSLIEDLRRDRQLSILFTSHNMGEVSRICDEVIFLDHGKIVSIDTPANHTKRLDRARVTLHYVGPEARLENILQAQAVEYDLINPATQQLSCPASAS
jgi:ABC-type multidrug transport system ATPase subunit